MPVGFTQVFISYSHKDDTWRVDLKTHLRIESCKRTSPSDHSFR